MTAPTTDSPNDPVTPRDQAWLEQQLETIWSTHFHDVAKLNTVTIRWGRASRTRLGTITARGGLSPQDNPEISEIRINPLLQNIAVPETVVWQTIAHELSHYCHGFCSPHPRRYDHPHRGNIVFHEFRKRNLENVHDDAQIWLKAHWHPHVTAAIGPRTLRRKKRRTYAKRQSVSLLSNINKVLTGRHRVRRRRRPSL